MASTWTETIESLPSYGALSGDLRADVCIVGAGITGVTTAYLLSKAGKNVVLIERDGLKESATAHTTAFITHDIDTALVDLCRMFGSEKATRIWTSLSECIDHMEETIITEHINCEFTRVSYYTYARDEREWEDLSAEAQLARHLGFPMELHKDEGRLPFKNTGYIELKHQAKFHALQYIAGLLQAAEEAGARIFFDTEAVDVRSDGTLRIVQTKKGDRISADAVVAATYYPFTEPALLFAHTGRYITYIFEAAIRSGALPEALYQDDHNPYHYFRIDQKDGYDRLIVGGEDHRREVPIDKEKNYHALEEYIRELLPDITMDIHRKWHWSVIEPMDGLPFIGPLTGDPQQYVATGLSGTGMTTSRMAAEIISDAILGRKHVYADLYAADRVPGAKALAKKGKDYVGEFFGAAAKNMLRKH